MNPPSTPNRRARFTTATAFAILALHAAAALYLQNVGGRVVENGATSLAPETLATYHGALITSVVISGLLAAWCLFRPLTTPTLLQRAAAAILPLLMLSGIALTGKMLEYNASGDVWVWRAKDEPPYDLCDYARGELGPNWGVE